MLYILTSHHVSSGVICINIIIMWIITWLILRLVHLLIHDIILLLLHISSCIIIICSAISGIIGIILINLLCLPHLIIFIQLLSILFSLISSILIHNHHKFRVFMQYNIREIALRALPSKFRLLNIIILFLNKLLKLSGHPLILLL